MNATSSRATGSRPDVDSEDQRHRGKRGSDQEQRPRFRDEPGVNTHNQAGNERSRTLLFASITHIGDAYRTEYDPEDKPGGAPSPSQTHVQSLGRK